MKFWIGRFLIGLVVIWNLQCAIAFLWQPQVYSPGFELENIPGKAMVQGVGLLFLMWNVPYLVAAFHPQKHRISLYEAIVMQAIGLVGEAILLMLLPGEHLTIQATVTRFILYDASGLVMLFAALLITRQR